MYCKYTYNATTATALLADLVTLLTSTTTPTLSSLTTCVTTNSSISTQYSQSGWAVFDTPDANSVVLSAPVFDNSSKFKYLYLSVATAGFIMVRLFDEWDAVAHTGTWPAVTGGISTAANTTNDIPIVLSTQATLYIHASPRAINVWSLIGTSLSGNYGCVERSRVGAWDTTTNAFCNTLQTIHITNYNYLLAPYVVNAASVGQPKVASVSVPYTSIWGYSGPNSSFVFFDGNGLVSAVRFCTYIQPQNYTSSNASLTNAYALTRINAGGLVSYSNEMGSISDVCDIYVIPFNTGNQEDTIVAGTTTYILLGANGGRLVVPMG